MIESWMERAIEHLGADEKNELAIVSEKYRDAAFQSKRFILVAGGFLNVGEMAMVRNRVKAVSEDDLDHFMVGRKHDRCLLVFQNSGRAFVAVSGQEWRPE